MKVVLDGIMTEYVAKGNGKAVIFLHGWGSDANVFNGIYEELKDKYRVIGLNMPGFCGTDKPPKAWDVQDYVDFVAKFIEKLRLKNVYAIVGHSFGGRVILKGCATGELKPKKLIFIDTAGVKPKRTFAKRAFGVVAKVGNVIFSFPMLRTFRRTMKIRLYRAAGSSDYLNADGVMKETFKNVIDEDLTGLMGKISQRSLIIWGENDLDTPISDLYSFKKIKDSRAHILSGAGHYSFLDQPEKALKLIKDFLR